LSKKYNKNFLKHNLMNFRKIYKVKTSTDMREELLKNGRIVKLTLLFIFWSFVAFGEGTKEVMPTSADVYYFEFNRSGGQSIPFGVYTPSTYVYQAGTSSIDYRINIRVCTAGEIIKFGFKSNNSNTWYRIRRPSDGAIVVGPNKIPSAAAPGFIANYAQAVAGPASSVGATGYNDISYTTLQAGDYFIEFNQGANAIDQTTFNTNNFTLQYFDITVTSPANVIKPGRVWSKAWQFVDGGSAFRGSFYVYADDGIVTKLNSNGMSPYAFSISCNSTGVSNTGNPTVDQKSVAGPSTYPQYKLFFNDPDNVCFPTGTFGTLIGVPTVTGCGTNRCINMQVDRPGNIIVTLDLNGSPGFNPGTSDRQISFKAVAGMNCVPWDGLDGLGNNIPTGTTIKIQLDYLNGVTHLPLYDCEDNPNGYIVTLVRPAGPSPKLFWDDSNVIPAQYGNGTALDGKTNLTGCALATGCHRWNSRGSNTCPPCSETLNTWWYANIDTISVKYINTNVFVDANASISGTGVSNNFNSCGTLTPIQLNGAVTGPAGVTGQWSSLGTGTFSPDNTTLNAKYTPSAADIAFGSVKLKLVSVGGVCPAVPDSMVITLVPPPVVFAGAPQSACKNNPKITVSDATKNAATTSVLWSGAGTFAPNKTTVIITYTPTAAELAAGTATITLTGTGNAVCATSVSTVTFTYGASPTANAGGNKNVCTNNIVANLTGTVSAGATPSWTSASGCVTCFSAPGSVNTSYHPSAADSTAGSVVLTLTASSPGCLSITSNMTLTIKPAPTPNAGPPQTLCKNNITTATLAGSTANAASNSWSSSSGCGSPACFSSLTSMTPTYKPSATDLTNGSVTLTLTSVAPAANNCLNATSTVKITYQAIPVADAGPSTLNFCADNPNVILAGTIPAGATGTWSGGGGTYINNSNDLNATYTLTPAEVATGIVALYLTATGIGNCKPVKDSIVLLETPLPVVNAGTNKTVCRNKPTITITGTVSGSFSGIPSWTSATSGAAGFSGASFTAPNATVTYTLNATDLANGSVVLTLSANSISASCQPTKSSMTVSVTAAPTVSAGSNQTNVCFNPGTVSLNGFSSTGTGTWSGGAGTFSPNANTANATYNSTAGERAGGVTLTYTTTGNGNCNPVSASMTVSFAAPITVSAGAPITVCSNNAATPLNGSSPITGTGQWSGGGGTYSPNSSTLNATYTPSAAEKTAGSVTLTLTGTGVGACTAPTSTVLITISPAPVLNINAGAATANICADNPTANLSVTLPGTLGVVWTGGAGIYTPNNTTASITYTATNGEVLAGSVIMTATSTNNGLCNAVSDQITVVIAHAPTINAGSDQVLCGSTATASLTGTVTGSTGGIWSTNGTGSFSNNTSLTPTYTPSAADKSSGLITITFTSTGNGTCNVVTDQMTIAFTTVPTVNAGPDITVCSNTLPVQLAGSGSPATWSGGTGTFSSNTSATAIYTPGPLESPGTVILTLTTNPSGACPQKSDQVSILIKPAPVATAGPDQVICGNQAVINLTGSVNVPLALGGFWTTTGIGTIGNPLALNTTYTPAASEKPGTITFTLTTTGIGICAADTENVVVTISAPVTVFAGPDQNVCNDGTAKALSGLITGATGGTWSIVSGGTGTLTNPTSVAGATYTPNAADVTVTLRLTSTSNPAPCAAVTDDVILNFSPKPIVTVGANQTVCGDVASIALTGNSVTTALGQIWTTTGAGSFTPSNTALNPTYTPAAGETGIFTFTLTSTGNGLCAGVYSNSKTVTITPKPTVNAGVDKTVCKNNAAVSLLGTVTVATGGLWTTLGDGTFSGISPDGLTATYTPGTNDKTNGTVNLRLTTTTGLGTCIAVSDIMMVTITPSPTANGGPDRSVCANNKNVTLAGSVTVATGGIWTSLGTGSFSGVSANGLNATYTPSNADTTAHLVKLVLTSANNGTCNPVTDTVNVVITPAPQVFAGPDQVICEDSFFVKLDANFVHASAGIWTTNGTGSFFNSNATTDTAVYVPTPADRTAGTVTLTYTTTVQGSCLPVSDNLVITITKAPTVTTGIDQTICSDGTNITVSWTRNAIPTGIKWNTSGSGTFAPSTSVSPSASATYTPSLIDKAAGTVILTVTTTGNGTCKSASDQLTLSIIQKPTVNTGLDLTVCADVYNTGINLSPTVTNAASLNWTTSGDGAFTPDPSTKNATYFPSIADTTAKTVTLTLTANGNSPCTSSADDVKITINPVPIVNAGPDATICNGSTGLLNGKVLHASGGTWTTNGTGTFAPDANTLNASYIPSPADTTAGSVTLTLTSSGMGTCNPVSDQMIITLRKKPTANAGPDITICADAGSYALAGIVTNASGGTWSSSSGGGFLVSPPGFNAIYGPTTQDSLNGQVVLTFTTTGTGACAPVSDNMTLTINPIPSADAGPPSMTVCLSANTVSLNGTVKNATSGFWGSLGDGTFDNQDTLNTNYTFGPNDKAAKTVLFTFISQGNGVCGFYTDSIRVNFIALTTVNAGPDRTICRTDFPIHLQGTGTNATWSGGTAAQYSNINSLTSTYTPTAAEAAGASLMLTLTAGGTCPGPPSNVTFTFINGPSVSINHPLATICSNVNSFPITGVPNTSGNWTTTGSLSGFSSTTDINTTYTPTAADKTAGHIKFTYTVPATGFCNSVKDTVSITILPTPTVNAGPDQTRCANALPSAVNMNGTFTIAGGVLWHTVNGTGAVTSPTSVNAVYNAVAGDIAASPIKLVIESTGSTCSVQTDTMLITITPAPTLAIGSDTTMCADKTAQLSAVSTVATGGIWSTTGSGTFSPNVSTKTVVYTPSAADTSAGTVTVKYLTTGNGICNAIFQNKIITLTKKPIVNAGADDKICSGQDSVQLTATAIVNAPGEYWTSTGTGTFVPSNTVKNPYYKPSAQDKANGGVIFRIASTGIVECDSSFDYKTLVIIPSPVAAVNAGFDQTICKDETSVQLAGFIQIATAAVWNCGGFPCTGGVNSFLPDSTDLNAKFIPTAADKAAGTVTLRLTTTSGNGICKPVYDELTLTIIDIPVVTAGASQKVCADTAGIQLNGLITHATLIPAGYSWASSGNGIFTPNAFVANPVYVLDSTDKMNGRVSFTLTSTNNGTCQAYTSTVIDTVLAQPTISAGIDKATCANVPNVTVIGTMTSATGATWTSAGTGVVNPTSANGLTATYAPSAVDDSAGSVLLTITTTAGLGTCKAVKDQMILSIDPSPKINAGVDKTICTDNGNVSISGTVLNAVGGVWTTLGSGNFAPNINLSTTYTPSSADTSAHTVKLILTTTGNGLCLPEDDTITLTMDPKPIVHTGPAILCEVVNGSALTGSIVNSPGAIWSSSSGSGTFAASPTVLNATYYPSAADVAAGSVVLTLTASGNGTCNSVVSTTNLSITPMPVANAGPDQFVCLNTNTVVKANLDPVGTVYQWSKLSGAPILPPGITLDVTANKDTAFVLTVFDAKNCASVKDTVVVRTFTLPSISVAGTACLTDSNVIDATEIPVSVVPGTYQWYNTNTAGIMNGQNTAEVHPNVIGQYYTTYSYGGCFVTSPIFSINPSPVVAGIDKTNCVNNITTLTLSNVSGGSTFTYNWTSNPALTGTTNQDNLVVQSNLSFDTISYNVQVTNNFLCATSDSVYLISIGKPILTLQNDTLCQDQITTLIATPTNFGVGAIPPIESYFPSYIWTRDGVNLNNNSKTQVVTQAGKYVVEITVGDCNNNKDTSDIIYNKFAVSNLPDNIRFCDSDDSVAVLNATATPQTGFTYTYLWTHANETTPTISVNTEGEYYVTINSIIGTNSCPIKDSIHVQNLCPPKVFTPNVFTPDKDGNKLFKIYGNHFQNFSITIFNRWGEVIYSSSDANEGWDGTYKGKPMPMGVYTYIVYYDGEADEYKGPYKKEGEVLILR
jgi:gliding motility-associated-like protein